MKTTAVFTLTFLLTLTHIGSADHLDGDLKQFGIMISTIILNKLFHPNSIEFPLFKRDNLPTSKTLK